MNNSTLNKRLRYEIPIAVLCAAIFAWICAYVIKNPVNAFDTAIHDWFVGIRVPFLNPIIVAISYTGNWQFLTAVCAVLLLLPRTRRYYGFPLSVASLTCVGVYQTAKYLVERPRPDHAFFLLEQDGYSFPSGHALTAVVFFVLLAETFVTAGRKLDRVKQYRPWAITCGVWALLIGLSRLYVGVHWATDILGGWLLSAILVMAFSEIFHVGFATRRRSLNKV